MRFPVNPQANRLVTFQFPTEKQVAALRNFGTDPTGMSRSDATYTLGKLIAFAEASNCDRYNDIWIGFGWDFWKD